MALRFGIALWLAGIVAGFAAWEAYEVTPGGASSAADGSAVPTCRPSVVVFAHPRCPCTRATLSELAELLAAAPSEADVEVVFVRPEGVPDGWERTGSWDLAAQIPGARVRTDMGGVEARRAGGQTSGQVIARDVSGKVAFRGGLTLARGRRGDSPGHRAVEAILAGRPPEVDQTPVFGCPLLAQSAGCCSDSTGKMCK